MPHINLICIGEIKSIFKNNTKNIEIVKYYSFQIINYQMKNYRHIKFFNISKYKDIESEKNNFLLYPKNSYVISLDLTGKQYTSEEFSEK